jgi:hypothetical protein
MITPITMPAIVAPEGQPALVEPPPVVPEMPVGDLDAGLCVYGSEVEPAIDESWPVLKNGATCVVGVVDCGVVDGVSVLAAAAELADAALLHHAFC